MNKPLRPWRPPVVKRTVEGDLGMRHNAPNIIEAVGERKLLEETHLSSRDLKTKTAQWTREVERIPHSLEEASLDAALAGAAIEVAVKRHVGHLEVGYSPAGPYSLLYGKDLRSLPYLIGT